ncbi:uncharacterized protein FTJAE_14064 [Fusarium tjaetaba]|uniref:Uncharacterized protein n=1 Tax=Fusarium tjaetaba TaxID=1567544 RepID=A0A8H5V829_9HYPO|nr:uncharacterized protein FTJAE_14064 [Fusarium tjaetaba]KAF5612633.1 hypothetical protein FTJAE_14064 [Fusarium tjaetaba]
MGRELDRNDMPSLDVPIGRIIGSTSLAFRPDVEIPELCEIDSETDEGPETPPDAITSYAGWNRTIKSDNPPPLQRATLIGGAVAHNLSYSSSTGQPAQLVAKILDDETETPPMPFLILPDERRGGPDTKSTRSATMDLPGTWSSTFYNRDKSNSEPIALALTALKAGGAREEKEDDESEKEKLGSFKMEEFVLSEDIDDFGGIKGLTAKL